MSSAPTAFNSVNPSRTNSPAPVISIGNQNNIPLAHPEMSISGSFINAKEISGSQDSTIEQIQEQVKQLTTNQQKQEESSSSISLLSKQVADHQKAFHTLLGGLEQQQKFLKDHVKLKKKVQVLEAKVTDLENQQFWGGIVLSLLSVTTACLAVSSFFSKNKNT